MTDRIGKPPRATVTVPIHPAPLRNPKPTAVDRWTPVPSTSAEKFRKLGIEPDTKGSKILDVLGPERFAEVPLQKVPGQVVWFNPDLARLMGFEVPPSNRLTPELEAQLIDALSYKVVEPGQEREGADKLTGYADKYGGYGLGYNKGAGRAAFLPSLNVNIKGVGPTPLVSTATSFDHRHGGAPMSEGFLEAIWGEVGANLFLHGSTRILAVIDNADFTRWQDGGSERRALIVRCGDQIRPGHFFDSTAPRDQLVPIFLRAATESGVLVNQADGQPDLAATMKRIIDNHARTAAESYRFRVMHGALSPSNMELDGSMLDLGSIQSQPRTAPIRTLPHITRPDWFFGQEHLARANQLAEMYGLLIASVPKDAKAGLNATKIEVLDLMKSRYREALEKQLLGATGLRESLAIDLSSKEPKLVRDYAALLGEMAALRNPGSVLADKEVIREIAVLDVFNLLRQLPQVWYGKDPPGATVTEVAELLRPIYRGAEGERETEAKVQRLARDFLPLYGRVLAASERLAPEHHDDVPGFRRALTQRAAFENEPMDRLYRAELGEVLKGGIERYQNSGDREVFREIVDKTISASLRNVEGLYGQGEARAITNGVEFQRRTIDGIGYSVVATHDGKRKLSASIPVAGNDRDGYHLDLPGRPHLHRDQIDALRYRFTTNGWADQSEVQAKLVPGDDGLQIRFEIPVLRSEVGRLEGLFHCSARGDFWLKDGASNFRGYTFAVPDNRELAEIAANINP